MPEVSLKALAREAEACGAMMVIRGLVNNEFAQTSQKLQALKISVDIDPPLFEDFKVQHVPTFVHCKLAPEGSHVTHHDRISGHLTLYMPYNNSLTDENSNESQGISSLFTIGRAHV